MRLTGLLHLTAAPGMTGPGDLASGCISKGMRDASALSQIEQSLTPPPPAFLEENACKGPALQGYLSSHSMLIASLQSHAAHGADQLLCWTHPENSALLHLSQDGGKHLWTTRRPLARQLRGLVSLAGSRVPHLRGGTLCAVAAVTAGMSSHPVLLECFNNRNSIEAHTVPRDLRLLTHRGSCARWLLTTHGQSWN